MTNDHNVLLSVISCSLGVGLGMVIISFIGSIYYNMIIGWSLYYMFMSWTKTLPWATCSHGYNTESKYVATTVETILDDHPSATTWPLRYIYSWNTLSARMWLRNDLVLEICSLNMRPNFLLHICVCVCACVPACLPACLHLWLPVRPSVYHYDIIYLAITIILPWSRQNATRGRRR